jgi:hypothetical protein
MFLIFIIYLLATKGSAKTVHFLAFMMVPTLSYLILSPSLPLHSGNGEYIRSRVDYSFDGQWTCFFTKKSLAERRFQT